MSDERTVSLGDIDIAEGIWLWCEYKGSTDRPLSYTSYDHPFGFYGEVMEIISNEREENTYAFIGGWHLHNFDSGIKLSIRADHAVKTLAELREHRYDKYLVNVPGLGEIVSEIDVVSPKKFWETRLDEQAKKLIRIE